MKVKKKKATKKRKVAEATKIKLRLKAKNRVFLKKFPERELNKVVDLEEKNELVHDANVQDRLRRRYKKTCQPDGDRLRQKVGLLPPNCLKEEREIERPDLRKFKVKRYKRLKPGMKAKPKKARKPKRHRAYSVSLDLGLMSYLNRSTERYQDKEQVTQ